MKTGTSHAQHFRICAAVQNINKAKYFCCKWQRSRPWLEPGRRRIIREKCYTKPLMFKSALALSIPTQPSNSNTDTHSQSLLILNTETDHKHTGDSWWWMVVCVYMQLLRICFFCCRFVFPELKLFQQTVFLENWSHLNMSWWESPGCQRLTNMHPFLLCSFRKHHSWIEPNKMWLKLLFSSERPFGITTTTFAMNLML